MAAPIAPLAPWLSRYMSGKATNAVLIGAAVILACILAYLLFGPRPKLTPQQAKAEEEDPFTFP